ncbi:phosphopantetheine adenylyltransferase [Mobilisporobacter senegalensis]|uniref:Phosphopantetheine adenylyltransferase n=1 Tax=Mobilisporobacter senegalensis TaxID=1329262 RepID=A0A3N1XT83_9FIRM|nr:pantetheine-phosphate adenylyltransferase [Mobilisporobacter senegalensis]ROR29448.1 phosphopantetheine adenylyltransferase [Mobilisporobacter senegalensis]
MRIGIYPGSFDPVTLGHLDIIIRSSRLVDKLVIGVLINSSKNPLFTVQERVNMLKEVTKSMPNVEVEAFEGLLVDFADLKKADIIVRGLRAVTDFEYELQIAQINHKVNPRIDTVFLTTSVEFAYLSSSVVREIAMYNGRIDELVPKEIVDKVYQKYKDIKKSDSI